MVLRASIYISLTRNGNKFIDCRTVKCKYRLQSQSFIQCVDRVPVSQGLKAGLAAGIVYGLMVGMLHLGALEACRTTQLQYIATQITNQNINATAGDLFATDLVYYPMIYGLWPCLRRNLRRGICPNLSSPARGELQEKGNDTEHSCLLYRTVRRSRLLRVQCSPRIFHTSSRLPAFRLRLRSVTSWVSFTTDFGRFGLGTEKGSR